MKNKRIRVITFLLIVCLLTGAAGASSAGSAVYTRTLRMEDLTYTNTICYSASGTRLESFQLETAVNGSVYPIVMACDTIYGGMTLPSMVSYAESQGYNVVGAINSDYFYGSSIPIGLVIENGIYKSSPEWNNAVAFLSDGSAIISKAPTITITLENHGGAVFEPDESGEMPVSNEGETVSLTHYNKTRADGEGLYLLNEYYSTVSTRTSTDGWMVRLRVLSGEMTVNGTMEFEVEECIEGSAAVSIGEDCYILTADATSNLRTDFEKFAPGDRVSLHVSCSDERLENAEWASGVGSILVSDGEITDSASWTLSSLGKNPRSALGIRADGSVVVLAADGRQSGYSGGLTMAELAQDLLALGCVQAVNMDGGGSTVMGVKTTGKAKCEVVNSPSDGAPRRCAAYILFVTDSVSDGVAKTLGLSNDGALVLAGSSLVLDYTASDAGLAPVSVPADITAHGSMGTVESGVYTAGSAAGQDVLTISSAATGASGTANIFVAADLDSIAVRADGKAVASLVLESGEHVQFTASAAKWGRAVYADAAAFRYAAASCGTVDESGLFTAGVPGSTGMVTVTAGGKSAEVQIRVKAAFSDCTGHWAENYINSLADRGVVGGITVTTFAPESGIKRGDFMLMLYRAVGEPAAEGENPFSDVPDDKYYAAAVRWAAANGIAQGDGTGCFMPEQSLTREQGFAFLYRALNLLGVTYVDGDADGLEAFTDSATLSDYAVQPTATLLKLEVVNGAGGRLDPRGGLTRAQMAKLLYVTLAKV